MFDPVFTDRCSPFTWLGPKRYTEMPCKIEDLPLIDAVIISHSHYDHLSHPTLMKIKERNSSVHFFVPLGNKKWFDACGLHNSTELDWWESREIELTSMTPGQIRTRKYNASRTGVEDPFIETHKPEITATIGCLPCQHTSGRTPFDKSHTLWSSWSVESGGKKIWFGGYVIEFEYTFLWSPSYWLSNDDL